MTKSTLINIFWGLVGVSLVVIWMIGSAHDLARLRADGLL